MKSSSAVIPRVSRYAQRTNNNAKNFLAALRMIVRLYGGTGGGLGGNGSGPGSGGGGRGGNGGVGEFPNIGASVRNRVYCSGLP